MPYRHDYHTHTTASPDGRQSLPELINAAIAAGLTEIAVTDHVDFGCDPTWQGQCSVQPTDEIEAIRASAPLSLVRGVELGQAHHDPAAANAFLDGYQPEFIIGSLHNLRNTPDFYFFDYHRPELLPPPEEIDYRQPQALAAAMQRYIDELFELVDYGRFHVLGHLTYPLRYFVSETGFSFDPFHEQIRDLFYKLIDKGLGIELNVAGLARAENRTHPDLPLLCLYRQCGGEIITLGSDAHYAERVGRHINDGVKLLQQAGFTHLSRFTNGQLTFELL